LSQIRGFALKSAVQTSVRLGGSQSSTSGLNGLGAKPKSPNSISMIKNEILIHAPCHGGRKLATPAPAERS
jgi:hypothetical protein